MFWSYRDFEKNIEKKSLLLERYSILNTYWKRFFYSWNIKKKEIYFQKQKILYLIIDSKVEININATERTFDLTHKAFLSEDGLKRFQNKVYSNCTFLA